MTTKRNLLGAGLTALALALPTLASAEQAPSQLCDGAKVEKQQPTAERAEQNTDKSQKKSEEKRDGKTQDGQTDRVRANDGKTS